MKLESKSKIQGTIIAFLALMVVGLVAYQATKPVPRVAEPVSAPVAVIHGEKVEPPTVPLALSSPDPIPAIPRPILDDCPPGIEVSYRVVDGKMIVDMPFDELESQIRAKVLCHIGNQIKLVDYIEGGK